MTHISLTLCTWIECECFPGVRHGAQWGGSILCECVICQLHVWLHWLAIVELHSVQVLSATYYAGMQASMLQGLLAYVRCGNIQQKQHLLTNWMNPQANLCTYVQVDARSVATL